MQIGTRAVILTGFIAACGGSTGPAGAGSSNAGGGTPSGQGGTKPAGNGLPANNMALRQIALNANGGTGPNELVNIGIPFSKGTLTDAQRVRILNAGGQEVPSFIEPTLRWHKDGSIRAVRAQFRADMSSGRKVYRFDVSQPRTKTLEAQPYDSAMRAGKESFPVPRVVATLSPLWMVNSNISPGQRVDNGTSYDKYIRTQYDGWAKDAAYQGVNHWLFDRVSVLLKYYIRSGRPDVLAEAVNSYRFYMDKIKTTGKPGWSECAGGFKLGSKSPCDSKYVYLEPILLMTALTGDTTQADENKIDLMTGAWTTGGWSYPLQPYSTPKTGGTERHWGLMLAAVSHAYELTGKQAHLESVNKLVGYLHGHLTKNPDGLGNDGCFRHSWAVHEGATYPGNVADDRGCSPWMSAMLIGGLWRAYHITGDRRIPPMVRGFAQWMERYGWIPQSWVDAANGHDWKMGCNRGRGTIGAYWSSSTAKLSTLVRIQESEGWFSDLHNPELRFPIAWAHKLETDGKKKAALAKRLALIDEYFVEACAARKDTVRAFNWQHRDVAWP